MKSKLLFFFFIPFITLAQIPAYYSPINFNLTGNNLRLQLAQLITETHTTNLPYTSSDLPDTWDALKLSDLDPTNANNVLLIYGWNDTDAIVDNDRTRSKDLSCHTSSCTGLWVREHVYPRSLGNPNLGFELAGSDAHNLRSIDNTRNNTRSNRIFEQGTGTASYITAGGNWYPGDEWRGDVARMMMYMYVRYGNQCLATVVGAGSTSYSTLGDMPNVFLDWNVIDPVSPYEITRNTVLQNMQGNRNPFIDNPYLATLIWNGPAAADTWNLLSINTTSLESIYIYPTVTYDYVTISNSQSKTFEYIVYNYIGQSIYSGTTTGKIDISNNASGMYIIKLDSEGQSKSFKVFRK
jgi:endonuclease I